MAADRLIVRFRPGIRTQWARVHGSQALVQLQAELPLPPGAALLETTYEKACRAERGPNASAFPASERHVYIRLPAGTTVVEWARRLARHPWVDYAEPDWVVHRALIRPNDPAFANQWHLENTIYRSGRVPADLRMPEAWGITQGSSNVTVAVLDTGLNARLPEFAGRVVPGYDFVNADADPEDDGDHGTAVAAILGATGNNLTGIAGIDWHCRIMPVKVLSADPDAYSSWLADGIDWAVDHGAKVLNLSLAQSSEGCETVSRAISNAIARRVIVVSITSNEGIGTILYPGSLPEVITVGASDVEDRRWPDSNYGPEIDLIAPGAGITTLHSDGSVWPNATGTSAAAPMVSGVVALLASLRPDLDQEQARALLCAGADDSVGVPEEDSPGFDVYHGWGRLNAYNSLLLAQARMDNVRRLAEGGLTCSWATPPNAATKRPYRVEYADHVRGPWTALPADAVQYQGTLATWTSGVPEPGKFYRLRVVVE